MTPDEKYFLSNSKNLRQTSQMQWSKKLKTFSELFTPFVKYTFNFEHFEMKDESHSLCLIEIIDCEIRAYVNLRQTSQMQWSKKLKTFSELFTPFVKYTFNFEHFEMKDESHSLCLIEIIDCEIRAYVNV